jgi:hypothetical protein
VRFAKATVGLFRRSWYITLSPLQTAEQTATTIYKACVQAVIHGFIRSVVSVGKRIKIVCSGFEKKDFYSCPNLGKMILFRVRKQGNLIYYLIQVVSTLNFNLIQIRVYFSGLAVSFLTPGGAVKIAVKPVVRATVVASHARFLTFSSFFICQKSSEYIFFC